MTLCEGLPELTRLVASTVPAGTQLSMATFGIPAIAGARGWMGLALNVADALLSGAAGISGPEPTAGGVALAMSPHGLVIVRAEREMPMLQRAQWTLRAGPTLLPWTEAARTVTWECPNDQQLFVTLPGGTRYMFWDGIAGLVGNLAGAMAIARALSAARQQAP